MRNSMLVRNARSYPKQRPLYPQILFNPKQAGGDRIRPQALFSLSCAETVNSRKLKLCDFQYILISFHSEYNLIPLGIHCCHGNTIVEECLVHFWLKSIENCTFWLKLSFTFSLGLFLLTASENYPPHQISTKSEEKQRSSEIRPETEPKYKMTP